MVPIRKRFGQHFLEPAWVEKVLRVINPQPDELFLEVGPGRGAITRPLAARARHVVAVEIDRDLARDLRTWAAPNVTVVAADFLQLSAEQLHTAFGSCDGAAIRVAGNLPYNVGSPILFRLVDLFAGGVGIVDAVVMLQAEVAERLTAAPGSKDYGVLSVLIGHCAAAQRLLTLPPGAFRPSPAVRSAVVRLTFHPPTPPVRRPDVFTTLVQAVFTRRRKTLVNALGAFQPAPPGISSKLLADSGLDPKRRPETLSIQEFARLADLSASWLANHRKDPEVR